MMVLVCFVSYLRVFRDLRFILASAVKSAARRKSWRVVIKYFIILFVITSGIVLKLTRRTC